MKGDMVLFRNLDIEGKHKFFLSSMRMKNTNNQFIITPYQDFPVNVARIYQRRKTNHINPALPYTSLCLL